MLSNDQIFEHPHLISQSSNFTKTQNYTKCNNGSSIELRSGRNTDAEEFTSQNNYIIRSQNSIDTATMKSDCASRGDWLNRESLSGIDDINYSPSLKICTGPNGEHVIKPRKPPGMYSALNTDNFS